MGVDVYTLAIGSFIALVALKTLFDRPQGKTSTERIASRLAGLAFVVAMAGWLMMWFTEPEIWSSVPKTCSSLASIELKGRLYQSCSYLVHRYKAGERIFEVAWFAGFLSIMAGLATKRRS